MRKAVMILVLSAFTMGSPVLGQVPSEQREWWSVIDSLPPGVAVLAVDSLYGFEAENAEVISLYLRVFGPTTGGDSFHGQHRSSWRYSFDWERNDEGECRPAELTILLRSVIVMPHLFNADSVDARLRDQWRTYTESLREHEEGHREILREALGRLREDMLASPFRSCSEYPEAFQPIQDLHREERLRLQAAYDSATGHGRTQGAVWPPRGGGR